MLRLLAVIRYQWASNDADISDAAFGATDELTGLESRRVLEKALRHEHERSALLGTPYSLILLNLDRFKLVNDTYGHRTGDVVLQTVARVLQRHTFGTGVLGRWSGEEFLCLLPGFGSIEAAQFAEGLRAAVSGLMVSFEHAAYSVSASAGVAAYPEHGDSAETVLGRADMALYRAKREGRDRIVVARGDNHGLYYTGRCIVKALEAEAVRVAYQPIVDMKTGATVAYEALARIDGPDDEVLAASKFIDLAEDLQLVHLIDGAVIPQVTAKCALQGQPARSSVLYFVNITVQLLRYPKDVERLLQHDVGSQLVIEITERSCLHDLKALKEGLRPFLDRGYRLAIDDFGSGFAPLVYLAELPISFIKVDSRFARGVGDARMRVILDGICTMAGQLGATTIAEGIEDESTARMLTDAGVDWAQGYYYGRPEYDLNGKESS